MNNKGSAAVESLPAAALLILFVAGILAAAYLIFARAWLQYQGEQALYCLSEARPVYACRRRLETKLSGALPWGKAGALDLSSRDDVWKVRVEWKIRGFRLQVRKELGTRRLLQSRALHW
jgi:hypothetical protein